MSGFIKGIVVGVISFGLGFAVLSLAIPVEPDKLRTLKFFVRQPARHVSRETQHFRFVVEDKASFETDEYKATFNAPERRR